MAPVVLLRAAVALAGRFPVLSGVDLAVDAGEAVLVEGPNGAGKTSLLRACAGLLALESGEVSVLGADLRSRPGAVRRQVGLLAHAPSLYDELTVRENVRFFVRAAGGDASGVDGALERLGLTGRLPRTAGAKLSAGQRRRVALAALVARDPRLWLLDEPHAALDRDGRALLHGVLTDALGRGATVIVASHEQADALGLVGRVVTMAGGRVVADRLARPRVVEPARPAGGAHVA